MQQKEKVRVYALAKMLNVESKDLLDMCQDLGFDVKNQLSSLDPEQREAIEQRVKQGAGGVAVAAPPKPAAPPVVPPSKVRDLGRIPSRPAAVKPIPPPAPPEPAPAAPPVPPKATPTAPPPPKPVAQAPPAPTPPAAAPPTVAKAPAAPAPEPKASEPPPLAPAAKTTPTPTLAPPVPPTAPPVAKTHTTPPAATSASPPPPPQPTAPPAATKPEAPSQAPRSPEPRMPQTPAAGPSVPAESPTRLPDGGPRTPPTAAPGGRPRDLNQPRPESGPPRRQIPRPRPGFTVVARPQQPLRAQKPVEEKKQQPVQAPVQKPIANIPKELQQAGKTPINVKDLLKGPQALAPTAAPPAAGEEDTEDEAGKSKDGKKKPIGVVGRDQRHKDRAKRQEERKGRENEKKIVLDPDEERRRSRSGKHRLKQKRQPGTLPPKSETIVVELPITVRSLSEAMGVRSTELLFKLRDHGMTAMNLNQTVDPEVAQVLALEYGKELEIKRAHDAEAELYSGIKKADNPDDLLPRAPIVTIMGHVDHGKTSLLDRIRSSNVVATEAGGITQVIRAWRVDHGGRPVTFLDTPGHEAFTKMRARGANVTDIAVIVCAADDGVMPQTEEAINHAKAAGVSIVIAINKVDLPNANVMKARQQLYGLNVLPDNMGGDTPFVETSAATGKGIDELLEQLSVVAELKELKANPKRPGEGTCLEAKLDPQEGVQATLLVQNGTLRAGDVILCGGSYGRVRAMYDDLGRPLQEAGPSVPVRITGLDEIPNADDPFVVAPDLSVAREIAETRRDRVQEAANTRRAPMTLDSLNESKIVELKVILKAEARGSVEAIRKELEKLRHEEVRVRILEAGIGAITENDVWLALTSPRDTLVVGFNVVPDDRALALAEERGIKIREYDIIYKLTDDIRSALEGKLKPREETVHLGRAVVRQTFRVSRAGTIAGCYVTQGTMDRSAKVRVIREGVVIFPPADRTAGLESLKRFKEDVREVREGFECGCKVAGYDDIKVGDVIESYRIDQVQRTLDK